MPMLFAKRMWNWSFFQHQPDLTRNYTFFIVKKNGSPHSLLILVLISSLSHPVSLSPVLLPPHLGYHHSLPSSPFSTGPEGQRLTPSGTLSTEFLVQGIPVKILLLVCNAAGAGQQAVRYIPSIDPSLIPALKQKLSKHSLSAIATVATAGQALGFSKFFSSIVQNLLNFEFIFFDLSC